MRPRLLWFLALLLAALAPTGRSADSVALKIQQVGLEGAYTNNSGPTWVQIGLRNTTDQTLDLQLKLAELNLDAYATPLSGTCITWVTLAAGQKQTVNVPLSLVPRQGNQRYVIYAEALDSQGIALGRAGRRVEERTEGQLIGLLCASSEVCRKIRESILLVGSPEEQSRKSQNLRIIQLSQPPPVDWAYSFAKTVVVAVPASTLSPDQREALELYVLRGGTLVLLEDQLADANSRAERFLAPYRSHATEGKIFPAAAGTLLRVSSLTSKDFADYFRPLGFSSDTPTETRQLVLRFNSFSNNHDLTGNVFWLTRRLATSFRFPSFFTLLIWIGAYLVLVGLVNFVVLRRIGRPEWGWVTIPALAVLFSVVLYLVSVRTHPSNFGLDEMIVYHMTDRSALAASDARVRVSAPIRSLVRLVLPGNVLYSEPQNRFSLDIIGLRLDRNAAPVNEFQVGQSWEMLLPLRRWSFRDFDFSGQRRFSGSVYRDSAGRLHNESGVNFQEAIVADERDVFLLKEFPSGAVVDLARVSRLDYASQTGRGTIGRPGGPTYPKPPFLYHDPNPYYVAPEEDRSRFEREYDSISTQPFSLVELIRGWPRDGTATFDKTKAVFLGFTSDLPLGSALSGQPAVRKSSSLVVVTFGEWP